MHRTLTDEPTGDSITVSKIIDGHKNTVFVISGRIFSPEDSLFEVIDLTELTGGPHNLRLDSVIFLVKTGLLCELSYKDVPYVLPFEGKGKADFDPISGLTGSQLVLTFKGTGTFFLALDISK